MDLAIALQARGARADPPRHVDCTMRGQMVQPNAPYPGGYPPSGYPPPSPGYPQPPPAPAAPLAKVRNHGALWVVSLLVGGGLIALGFVLHASWEHSPGYPRALRHFINTHEGGVLVIGGLVLTCLFAALAYRRGWFSKLPLQARVDLGLLNARLDAAGGMMFPVELLHATRLCLGTFMLTPAELIFRCLHDESMMAASASKVVSQRLGLIGGLIGGAVSSVRARARDRDIAAVRAATDPLPFDQQLAFNPHSFRLAPNSFGLLSLRARGRVLHTPKGDYVLHELPEEQLAYIVAWLTRRGVRVDSV